MNYKQILHMFYSLILGIFIIGVESFIPKGRFVHSSVLVGTKLYFFGGMISRYTSVNEVFYLDVSQTFNVTSPLWTDLTISAKIPFASSWAGMSLIDINSDIYLFGGIMSDPVSGNDTFVSIIHSFNTKTLEWKIPDINGKIPERRRNIRAVSDYKGKLYVFGGSSGQFVGSPITQFFNDMVILDTTSLIWSYDSSPNAPTKRAGYSATILKNGVIVYIGGRDDSNKANDINQIYLYDTSLNTWSVMTSRSTNLIESRSEHSAVLDPGGNIIIYGGANFNSAGSNDYASVEPDIAILNTQSTPFEWIVPTVSSNIGKIPSLYSHTANLVGNCIIVAFGRIVPTNVDVTDLSQKIYIMDIRNYTWIDTFDSSNSSSTLTPTLTPTQTPSIQIPNSEDKKTVVIGTLSGVIGIACLSAIGFLGYKLNKKYKRKRKQILNIPGSI